MADVADAIDRVFSHLETLLRYVASGFVALLVAQAAGLNGRLSPSMPPEMASWTAPLAAALLGVTLYAINTNFLVPVLYFRFVIWLNRRVYPKFTVTGHQEDSGGELMYQLVKQRWLRRTTQGNHASHIQKELDRWSSLLNYLYCASLAFLLVAVAMLLERLACSMVFLIILVVGILLLVCALVSDYRITGYEFRIWRDYPLPETDEDVTGHRRTRAIGEGPETQGS